MHYYGGNPSKLPYICCLFDPQKEDEMGNLTTAPLVAHLRPWKLTQLAGKWTRIEDVFPASYVNLPEYKLPETNSSRLKMDGWNTYYFSFWGKRLIFRCFCC